MYKSSQILRTV